MWKLLRSNDDADIKTGNLCGSCFSLSTRSVSKTPLEYFSSGDKSSIPLIHIVLLLSQPCPVCMKRTFRP